MGESIILAKEPFSPVGVKSVGSGFSQLELKLGSDHETNIIQISSKFTKINYSNSYHAIYFTSPSLFWNQASQDRNVQNPPFYPN